MNAVFGGARPSWVWSWDSNIGQAGYSREEYKLISGAAQPDPTIAPMPDPTGNPTGDPKTARS